MALKDILLSIMSTLKMNSTDYCDLESVAGADTLVFKDGTLLTLLRYEGMLSQVSGNNFVKMIDQASDQLNKLMLSSGYKFVCVFKKDLDAFSSLARIENLQKKTADNLQLELYDIIEENVDTARKNVYDEEVYFGLMTNMQALDPVELDSLKIQAKKKPDSDMPKLTYSQNLHQVSNILLSKHSEFVQRFIGCFRGSDYYVSIERINAVKALSVIRHSVQPNSSPRNWIPAVALDQQMMREQAHVDEFNMPVMFPSNQDYEDQSHIMPPELPRQLLSQSIEVLGASENLPPNTIRCDGRLYASVFMDIPPTSPAMFNELFSAFNNTAFVDTRGQVRSIPWSITFLVSGDGMAGSIMKKVFKDIVGLAPPSTNANLQAAYNQLNYLKKNDKAVVGIQCSAMTWVDDVNDKSRELLTKHKNLMKYAMEAWGSMKVIDNVGDPILGWRSNHIGMATNHVGTKGAAPLPHVLAMLPLTRPASAFKTGTVINRTLDGKVMLLEKFSSQMRTWVKCITGTPGSGKSVMLNNELLETCLLGGLERLPFITVIDKGESSSGFIELIRDRLPPHLKYLAVTKKLRKEKEYAINPFDVKVGLTRPLNDEKTQMVAFLTALLTPTNSNKPYQDTQAFVSFLIESMFDSIQEGTERGNPKLYQYQQNIELDKYIIDNEIIEFEKDSRGQPLYHRPLEQITYFALVRKLHKLGESQIEGSKKQVTAWRARDLAHRLAMPTLPEINSILSDPKTLETFTNEVATGETMPEFAKRAVAYSISAYPCFAHTTQFDVDTARLVSLDLQEVVSKQNPQQSSLFVQIARMIGVKKIGLSKGDIQSEIMPEMFKRYYTQELQNLNADKKVLAIDEMHNYRGNSVFMGLLEVDAREGRKWGLELILASQYISDFYFDTPSDSDGATTVDLLSAVTHMCLCTPPEGKDLKIFRDYFDPVDSNTGKYKIPQSTLNSIRLDSNGLTYLSCLKAKSKRYTQLLTLQVASKRLWSLTTTSEDRLIRNIMYELTNGDRTKAIAALAYYLPSGAKERVELMRNNMIAENSKVSEEEIQAKANSLVRDLAEQALVIYEAKLAYERQNSEEF